MKKIYSTLLLSTALTLIFPVATVVAQVSEESFGYGGDPVSCTMTATPSTITAGGGSTLTWIVSPNVVSAYLSPKGSTSFRIDVPLDGSWFFSGITDTRAYTLHLVGDEGQTGECDATIMVEAAIVVPPSCELVAAPNSIPNGGGTTLTWNTSTNTVSAVLHPTGPERYTEMSWFQEMPIVGSWFITGITNTRSYSLTVANANGDEYTCSAPITVIDEGTGGGGNPDLSCTVSATPTDIAQGGATTLAWTSSTGTVSAKLHPFGSTEYFADVTPEGSWYISGIVDTRQYSVTVYDEDGNSATCDTPVITVTPGEGGGGDDGDETSDLACEIIADPNPITDEDGATELFWVSSDNAVSGKLHPTGSTSYFADVLPEGSWFLSGITSSRSYSVTVFDAEGNSATCDAPIEVVSSLETT
jgi:hypothetical protein